MLLTCVRACVRVCVCVCVRARACVRACVRTYVRTCVRVRLGVRMRVFGCCVRVYMCIYLYISVHLYFYVYMYMCIPALCTLTRARVPTIVYRACARIVARAHAHSGTRANLVTCYYLIFPWNYSSHNPRRACTPTSRYSHFPIYTIPYILTSFQLPHYPHVDLNLHTTITNHFLFLINA